MIPYGRQIIDQADVDAVVEVLRSDFLTQGPAVPRFEAALREATGAAHALAVNSATSALHVACMALDLGPGDALWTVPNTFVASANCGLYCGASVDFVDIDPATYLMDADALEAKLATTAPPKVLVPVHFAGQTCDMERIGAVARAHGIRVIEDASHSIGASYRGAPVGDCRFSDAAVFSFHPVKIVTTAEGGAVTTQDEMLARRVDLHRSHGVTRDPALMQGESEGGWYYEQVALGYNYRMTEMQAALGASQMRRLGEFVDARHRIRARYDALLEGLPVVRPHQDPAGRSALHLYPVQVEDRARVFAHLREGGIGVNVHYIPVHLQPHYRAMGFARGNFPVAEAYYDRAISLPLHPGLTEAEQDRVVEVLREAVGG
ncbi:UDP-4-amino-4,6-dideoxy-N-acetyl-beta-L-altrosamine transaminase [Jannaschia sp. W003]|uniref:UDP-4-amino-4, 6-dideoxy-N-acetyl-beta-L-altrosamine transaminase n=1 Tax=Jannaschia sp. W003 TaxID=2867012 RepID=UPI0021A851A9|nr:UDP-4-amino-4,6-dideoxy-N-acetyl-beta-L-altrosamine transaminase [Jannaschia sp. W003]UWQ22021.1 UDP-4-amino-4,6-dideoxy-N-acetyl-beta-L-altrosamine transaminase [Jannaschia sp. W003]